MANANATATPARRKIAIVGAGWAGMAAALAVAQAGHEAIVLEAASAIGGRARALFDPQTPTRHWTTASTF